MNELVLNRRIKFISSKSMKVSVTASQTSQLCSKENIEKGCRRNNVSAFDVYDHDLLIGFVMVVKTDEDNFFLWNYAIDQKYQNRGYGVAILKIFIQYMQHKYEMKHMTTTYIWGNTHAKHVYEKVGFIETDVIDEEDCHEVNMIYHCG